MEKVYHRGNILTELEQLISKSCTEGQDSPRFRDLHQLLVKKHYNATEVAIDYHRKRIAMEVVLDDSKYHPGRINLCLPTFRVNLLYKDLKEFLYSCVATDNKSLAFNAWLLKSFTKREMSLTSAQ